MSAEEALGPALRARDAIERHSRSFSLAVKLLPEPARSDARIIYAWCRYADDAIDSNEGSVQRSALERLRTELTRVYAGTAAPEDWLLASFRAVVHRRGIPLEYPAELLAGMEMDVSERRYASLEELLLYCHRVASTVGLMMCHVFGVIDPAALRHAAHLGVAMQLTNICRDVEEDWQRGRLYLPLDLLRKHGARDLAPADPAWRGALPPQLVGPCRRVIAELLATAERHYASGDAGLRYLPWRAALAVSVARRVYAAIGDVLARAGHDATSGRAVVSRLRKVALVATALLQMLGSRGTRVRSPSRAPLPTVQYGPDLALL
jgi:15-cis-phytoene synthase